MGDIINATADLFGFGPASKQASATKSAASTSAAAAQYAADIQKQMFDRQMALQEPWRQAGATALNQLIPLASNYQPFTAANMYSDPGYQFRLAEGLKALDRSAAAKGGLQSGAALKAAGRYGQDYASSEYQNAFNRYLRERDARLNPLQSLAGVGQTTAGSMSGQAGALGSNLGNISLLSGANQANAALQMGNIRASQYGGYGSALGSALQYPGVQNYLGNLGTAWNYGTSPGSQQTNMLAAQEAGFF